MSRSNIGYTLFDADNHYYEAEDAFTRHLDPEHRARTVQWCEVDGRRQHLVAGKLARAVSNPTFDPIAKPGVLYDFFRGRAGDQTIKGQLQQREPIPPHYRDPESRLAVMDEQGLEWAWLFPTLGILYEELLKEDPEAVTLAFGAFNRWLKEDWGFAYDQRIFSSPYITMADVGWAVTELEWALENGARTICMRPAAVHTAQGPRSPGDPMFDPFWARVNEAGITVVIHAGDSGYTTHGYAEDGFSADFSGRGKQRLSIKSWNIERAALDYLATLILDRVFERYPNVRIASVENGSEFLPDLFRKLTSMARKAPGYFAQDPVQTFKQHVWINPFWEDDVEEVARYMGTDRVIFGSDWPHIEGLPEPGNYIDDLSAFNDHEKRLILRDNAQGLNQFCV